MTLRASRDYRHDQLRPCPSSHRAEEFVDRIYERRQPDAPMLGQVRAQVVRAASPLVDSSAPVAPRVVKAARRDLDQPLVKTCLGSFAVGHPLVLPALVLLPVAPAVEELYAAPEAGGAE